LSKIPVQGDCLGTRFASVVLYKDSLIAWGGKNSNDKAVSDISQIKLGKEIQHN